MNKEEFLEALSKTPRHWEFQMRMIRYCPTIGSSSCPVTAVAGDYGVDWIKSAEKVGLDKSLAWDIAMAADWKHLKPELRKELLIACSLEEL